jgi:hypothetical protein
VLLRTCVSTFAGHLLYATSGDLARHLPVTNHGENTTVQCQHCCFDFTGTPCCAVLRPQLDCSSCGYASTLGDLVTSRPCCVHSSYNLRVLEIIVQANVQRGSYAQCSHAGQLPTQSWCCSCLCCYHQLCCSCGCSSIAMRHCLHPQLSFWHQLACTHLITILQMPQLGKNDAMTGPGRHSVAARCGCTPNLHQHMQCACPQPIILVHEADSSRK